ncbi:GEVED domain-containing protein [Desulfococcaceae bacterium HSG9]|nr:GEVED domain-containing protein [Desulfococcaceae bacterium HSG9]
MKHIINSIIVSVFFLVFGAVGVHAYNHAAWGTDYGDATGYGQASNDKGIWQRLGDVNGIDDGVLWSVNDSDFGTTADLIIGEEVTFQFNLWQGNNGDHWYDQLYAVVDWNQDFYWDNSEVILYEKNDTLAHHGSGNFDLARYIKYETSFLVPETMNVGSTWLRARVQCHDSHEYGYMTPYGHLLQGETEDYQLSIVKAPDPEAPVPEPSTIILLSAGLLGLVCINRKKMLKKS